MKKNYILREVKVTFSFELIKSDEICNGGLFYVKWHN